MRHDLVEGEPETADDLAATVQRFLETAPAAETLRASDWLVGFATALTQKEQTDDHDR